MATTSILDQLKRNKIIDLHFATTGLFGKWRSAGKEKWCEIRTTKDKKFTVDISNITIAVL